MALNHACLPIPALGLKIESQMSLILVQLQILSTLIAEFALIGIKSSKKRIFNAFAVTILTFTSQNIDFNTLKRELGYRCGSIPAFFFALDSSQGLLCGLATRVLA